MLPKRNKPRLMLALYARPKHPNNHHYALLITPKPDPNVTSQPLPATKYHVKNTLQNIDNQLTQPWRFEKSTIPDIHNDPRLPVGVAIAKIISVEKVERTFQQTPVEQDSEEFDCRTWVIDTLERLRDQGEISGLSDWEEIERSGVEFVERKRREGWWDVGGGDGRVPVVHLVGREM